MQAQDAAKTGSTYKNCNVQDLLSLRGNTTVITGGGRGIGLALAYAVAQAGSNVAVFDMLPEPHADFAHLSDFGVKAKYYRVDVTDHKQIIQTFQAVSDDFGGIDGCITAAGIVLDKPFLEHGWDETLKVQMVNAMGTFFCAQEAAKHMKARGKGSIVMISSIAANTAIPAQTMPAYGASKAFVKSLSIHLGVELGPLNIRVNTISPGYIRTDMTAAVGLQSPRLLELFTQAPPMKKIGERENLMGAAVYLLSEASAYTTTADMLITGGCTLEDSIEARYLGRRCSLVNIIWKLRFKATLLLNVVPSEILE